jgi:hypothetical protein
LLFAARGVCPKKLSHFALHIQTMPAEPRGMVQDSPIPDTPMLERTLLAPKNRCVKRLSFEWVHLPQVEQPFCLSCTPAEPPRHGSRCVLFRDPRTARQNASAAQELGSEALPPKHDCSPHVQRCTPPCRAARHGSKYPIPEAPPVLRTLLMPPNADGTAWRFAAMSLTCPPPRDELATA